MQDVDAAKMTYYDGGVLGDDTIDAIFTAANFKSGNTADSINYFTFAIDVKNFSVDGDYDEGESYAIALLRLTDSESIYPVSSFSIVNSDQMGSNWILGETPLFWDESTTTLYLNVISQVPEPATYAAIFGALTLAFAAYRRRK
ncbi:MAG: PEP-CTERM sorting domain-containing protein [Opitutales bacterium]|nr:PEP-CTERM sorting domain-containing protein [Opitutales bacterium]